MARSRLRRPTERIPVRPIISDGPTSLDKARCIVAAFPQSWHGQVLDVGCRGGELRAALVGTDTTYHGLDITPPADIVADLDDGIPLPDRDVQVVVALDVLEHTDDIHAAFAELCRVAERCIIISLPNNYEISTRLAHLRGRPMSGKYGLPVEPPGDRHRWFFSMDDARRFCRERATVEGWTLVDEGYTLGPRRAKLGPLATWRPTLSSSTYVARLAPTA
jgi:SAM-dependent methyltransferase